MNNATHSVSEEAARVELAAVLASSIFARSRSLSNLLRYLCEKEFAGEVDQLKEYTIAVEAYGRPPDFQQREDSIVRVEIKRLREKLKQYYATEGANHELQISIPIGQYAPIFLPRAVLEAAPQAVRLGQELPVLGRNDKPQEMPVAAAPVTETITVGRSQMKKWMAGMGGWAMLILPVAIGVLWVTIHFFRQAAPTTPLSAAGSLGAVSESGPGAAVEEVRIRAGMQAAKYVDRAGRLWLSDRYFTGGNPLRVSESLIYRTLDPEIYQTGRQGDFTYDIPLKSGVYELRLHFAETFFGPGELEGGGETSRLFAVLANGEPLLKPIDIIAEAEGSRTAEIKVFKNIRPAADGLLHLRFYSWTHGKALLNALELLPTQPDAIRPIRISTQDKAVFTGDGREWEPDAYFKGGRVIPRSSGVMGTREPELFQSERFGHFNYAIPVAPGRYTLKLYFAERYFGPSNPAPNSKGPGSRLFDVFCNGHALLKNFDIYTEAGGNNRALTKTFSGLTPNAQGKLLLEFKPVVNYALLNAIEIIDEAWQ